MQLISAHNVTKKFGTQLILQQLSIEVNEGEIVGLLGPNGSGKTTFIRSILQMISYDEGHIKLFENPAESTINEAKRKLGVVPDTDEMIADLTGIEYLNFIVSVRDLNGAQTKKTIDKWLQLFQLEHAKNQLIENYSHGMKKKLQFISILLHEPKLIIFDEPTNGLDPEMIVLIRDILKMLKEKGVSILMTTHNLSFAEALCDQVLMIKNGQLLTEAASPQKLKKNLHVNTLEEAYLALTWTGEKRGEIHDLLNRW